MAFKEEENSMNSSVIQLLQDFHGVPFGLHFIGIPLHLLGLVQQIIIVIYERNELDPMKRSLTSQVSTYLNNPNPNTHITNMTTIFVLPR